MIRIVLAAVTAIPLAAPVMAAANDPAPAAGLERVVRLEVDAPGVPGPLASSLPVLLEAALEASSILEVIPPPPREPSWSAPVPPAGWRLQVGVSGKGPWKMSARVSPTGDVPSTRSAERLNGPRTSFSDSEGMSAAVDQLSAWLHEQWTASGLVPAGKGPVPLAQALSPSPQAVQGYAEAMTSLRAGDAAGSNRRFESVLKDQPDFAMAAIQKGMFDLARGAGAGAAPCRPEAAVKAAPLARAVCEALAHLAEGRAELVQQSAARLQVESPASIWALQLAGLSSIFAGHAKDALSTWRQAEAMDPSDPRIRLWLGASLMASGDFKGAAAALSQVRRQWPDLWRAYALEAESLARARDTKGAADVVSTLRREMDSRGAVPASDEESPELMMGSLQLMEGHFKGATEILSTAVDRLVQAGAPLSATRMLLETAVEMKRDLVTARDPLLRDRQLEEADAALTRLENAVTPEEREARPWALLRLRGLLQVKRGETAEAWRTVERIRAFAERPGYTGYEEAYLSAAIMLKEGDHEGALAQFQKAYDARGTMVDLMDLAQFQSRMQRNEDAVRSFARFEERLSSWDPRSQPPGELVITNPHLALLVPLYHLARAQYGFRVGNSQDSRVHYNRMLAYFRAPDEQFVPYVKEAVDRGARPE